MNMNKVGELRNKVFLTLIASLLVLLCESGLANAGNAEALFGDHKGEAMADAASQTNPAVIRSRAITVRHDLLGGAKDERADALPTRSIRLNLFPDTDFTAVLDRIEYNDSGSRSWIGHINGVELSQAIFVVDNGFTIGNISVPGASYQVRHVGNDVHVIHQVDYSKLPDGLEPKIPPSATPQSVPDAGPMSDSGSTIDVLVVYTPSARAAVGGTSAMSALIDLAATETNTGYSNSGVNHRIRVVNKTEVAYTEQSFDTDLDNITNGSGAFSDVAALRTQYGADEVVLIINDASSCGLAWLMTTVSTSFAPYGFAVVHHDCATGYYSFGHEIGHNMGARHDRYVDSSDTTNLLTAHGYLSVAGQWRTIMAYNNQCAAAGVNCTRIPYWSNPSVTYSDGRAMGIAAGSANAADNRTALNTTASTVANFKTCVVSCDTTSYAGTYTGQGVTIHLAQSSTTLSGTFSTGSVGGNMGGVVDSSGRAYVWAWWDSSTSGSGTLAGRLTLSGSQGTFSFGGGQSSGGALGETILSGMTQASLSGSTTTTSSSGTTNYAGTYSGQGVTITLSQTSSSLSGTFSTSSLSGTLGGFVDSSGRAFVWAWYDNSTSGSAALAGRLTLSGSQGTFSFGGGQSSGGSVGAIVLSNMTRS